MANNGTVTLSFEYNGDGLRTSKTVNGVKHTYRLNGSQIVSEAWGNHLLIYLYDAEGAPVGMMYRNDSYPSDTFDTFWFEKNLQGDIVAVYDEDGTKLISYTYDAWGNFTTTYHNGCTASNHANLNPFRYRGYFYDTETGLYYLQSRYYDPIIGRFVNADTLAPALQGLTGNNMFAYGSNRVDSQMHNQASPEGRIVSCISIAPITPVTTPSGATGGGTSSGSLGKSYNPHLFGWELRTSAGFVDEELFYNSPVFRCGLTSYATHIDGRDGLIYGFAGYTVDSMNLMGNIQMFAGYGINLGGWFKSETQLEILGIGHSVQIGKFSFSTSVNAMGAISLTLGHDVYEHNGNVYTDAITIGISAPMLVIATLDALCIYFLGHSLGFQYG